MKKFILSLLLCVSSSAHALELHGNLKQGGFIYGKTVPGATITLADAKTEAAPDGTFVIGLERNHPEKADLSILLLGGIEEKHSLTIEQREYPTQAIKGLPKRQVTPHEEDLRIIRADKKKIVSSRNQFSALNHLWQKPIRPTEGPITGVYGSRRTYNGEERNWHKGTDFAAPTGTPVKAPTDAKVALALPNSFYNGNLIILDHGHQLFSIYAHLNSMTVEKGDEIRQGDIIGTVGSTGRSTGPHLHWGVYWRQMALDPLLWLESSK